MKQICIYTPEIAHILGKSENSARILVRAIKDIYGKSSHQPVTIKEFCDYMDLPYKDVFDMINSRK